MTTRILGISAFYHDSGAALMVDGRVEAAAQEERFSRKRHDDAFPINAARWCMDQGGIASASELDYVVFYDKPFIKFERLMFTYLDQFPRGFRSFLSSIPEWMGQKLWMKSIIRRELSYHGPLMFSDHHVSHAASAFLVSPFHEAAILTVDGVGEWTTTTLGAGAGNKFELTDEIRFPHSLGLFYSAFTYYLGFKVNSGEYKLMGLAPYGKPLYYDKVRQVIEWKSDGSFHLNLKYFDYLSGSRMTSRHMDDLFGGPPRHPESRFTQREFDIAASVQKVTDDIMVAMASALKGRTGQKNLCMAGGVALNCVSNARVLAESGFERLWIQPAAGDAGASIGAAAYLWNCVLNNPRDYVMDSARLGPAYSSGECQRALDGFGARYRVVSEDELVSTVVRSVADGKVVGWFQGRMEFGPRALGSRSILADPRDPDMKEKLNRAIKFREGFRPFAPSIVEEKTREWFDIDFVPESCLAESPLSFMLLVADVLPNRRTIPSVTHLDGSARLQTVSSGENPLYHRLLTEFGKLTGVPILINTSFNVRGEPIVCRPEEAYRCFMRTNMDFLAIENLVLEKGEQPGWTEKNWRKTVSAD